MWWDFELHFRAWKGGKMNSRSCPECGKLWEMIVDQRVLIVEQHKEIIEIARQCNELEEQIEGIIEDGS